MLIVRFSGDGNIQVIEGPDPIPGPGEVMAMADMRRQAPLPPSVRGWLG